MDVCGVCEGVCVVFVWCVFCVCVSVCGCVCVVCMGGVCSYVSVCVVYVWVCGW